MPTSCQAGKQRIAQQTRSQRTSSRSMCFQPSRPPSAVAEPHRSVLNHSMTNSSRPISSSIILTSPESTSCAGLMHSFAPRESPGVASELIGGPANRKGDGAARDGAARPRARPRSSIGITPLPKSRVVAMEYAAKERARVARDRRARLATPTPQPRSAKSPVEEMHYPFPTKGRCHGDENLLEDVPPLHNYSKAEESFPTIEIPIGDLEPVRNERETLGIIHRGSIRGCKGTIDLTSTIGMYPMKKSNSITAEKKESTPSGDAFREKWTAVEKGGGSSIDEVQGLARTLEQMRTSERELQGNTEEIEEAPTQEVSRNEDSVMLPPVVVTPNLSPVKGGRFSFGTAFETFHSPKASETVNRTTGSSSEIVEEASFHDAVSCLPSRVYAVVRNDDRGRSVKHKGGLSVVRRSVRSLSRGQTDGVLAIGNSPRSLVERVATVTNEPIDMCASIASQVNLKSPLAKKEHPKDRSYRYSLPPLDSPAPNKVTDQSVLGYSGLDEPDTEEVLVPSPEATCNDEAQTTRIDHGGTNYRHAWIDDLDDADDIIEGKGYNGSDSRRHEVSREVFAENDRGCGYLKSTMSSTSPPQENNSAAVWLHTAQTNEVLRDTMPLSDLLEAPSRRDPFGLDELSQFKSTDVPGSIESRTPCDRVKQRLMQVRAETASAYRSHNFSVKPLQSGGGYTPSPGGIGTLKRGRNGTPSNVCTRGVTGADSSFRRRSECLHKPSPFRLQSPLRTYFPRRTSEEESGAVSSDQLKLLLSKAKESLPAHSGDDLLHRLAEHSRRVRQDMVRSDNQQERHLKQLLGDPPSRNYQDENLTPIAMEKSYASQSSRRSLNLLRGSTARDFDQ